MGTEEYMQESNTAICADPPVIVDSRATEEAVIRVLFKELACCPKIVRTFFEEMWLWNARGRSQPQPQGPAKRVRRDKRPEARRPKLVEMPYSQHGLTVCVMDSAGNVEVRTEEPIPEGFEKPKPGEAYDPVQDPAFWKRRGSGESGHEEHFPL